jgi:hypothetical protein
MLTPIDRILSYASFAADLECHEMGKNALMGGIDRHSKASRRID